MAERPRPPSIRQFQAFDSQVSRNMNSGGYSHQSENSAANRTMHESKLDAYSRSISSPMRLVSE